MKKIRQSQYISKPKISIFEKLFLQSFAPKWFFIIINFLWASEDIWIVYQKVTMLVVLLVILICLKYFFNFYSDFRAHCVLHLILVPERRVGSRYGWVRSLIVCSSSSTYYKGGWQQKVSLVLRGGRSYSAVRTKTTTATAGGPCSSCTPPTTYTLLCVCLSENTYLQCLYQKLCTMPLSLVRILDSTYLIILHLHAQISNSVQTLFP